MNWGTGTGVRAPPSVKQTARGILHNTGSSAGCPVMTGGWGGGGAGRAREGGAVSAHRGDSLCYTEDANTTL